MNNPNDMQEVEIHIEEARKAVAFGEAIQRLQANNDFQLVINEGYTTLEARRLTMLLGDPALENKAPIYTSLQAIGELHQYFRARLGFAEQMRKDILDAEEYMEQAAATAVGGEE